MKNKLFKAITFIMLLGVVFSGCSLPDFFAAENLIRPPKLTGENAALQQVFENTVGKDISLYSPVSGNHRASYILFDANSDSVDEAVVFYSLNSNSSVVHMHLLSQKNGEWYSVFDVIGSGTEVYKVDFYNIDKLKNLEIAVIWSVEDSKREKTLSVYKIASLDSAVDNALVSMATIQIADYVYFDVDSDKSNELLYLYYNSSEQTYSLNARLLDFDSAENAFVPLSDIAFNSLVSSISDIIYESDGKELRIYLECISPDNEMFTEILVFSKELGTLFNPQPENAVLSELTARRNFISCSDFDEDGYLDIPRPVELEGSYVISEDDNSDEPVIIEWLTFSDGEFSSLGKYFINEKDSFALKLDDFVRYHYIVYDQVNNLVQVRLRDSADENNIVFSVSAEKTEENTGILIGDGFLGHRNDREYNIIVTALGESLYITAEFVDSLIKDL